MDPLTLVVEFGIGIALGFFLGWVVRKLWVVFVGLGLAALIGIIFLNYSIPQYVEWVRTYAGPLIDLLREHAAVAGGAVIGFLFGLTKK
ncbi:hypothetical protein DRP77_06620 [Candidatus Poribacteria bacterium]|nr:MAG: hypothetical protein DRP77_06620 [Candidatus Poribacteria bacterium]